MYCKGTDYCQVIFCIRLHRLPSSMSVLVTPFDNLLHSFEKRQFSFVLLFRKAKSDAKEKGETQNCSPSLVTHILSPGCSRNFHKDGDALKVLKYQNTSFPNKGGGTQILLCPVLHTIARV